MPKLSLKQQVEQQISRTKQDVFLRADFEQLGGYDQVGRALRELVTEGKLLKIGYGLHAKARISSITGNPMLASNGGFKAVSEQALAQYAGRIQREVDGKALVTIHDYVDSYIPMLQCMFAKREKIDKSMGYEWRLLLIVVLLLWFNV